jgi:hypothetical protein
MSEKSPTPGNHIETREELSPAQELICDQLKATLDGLEGVEVQAIGITKNMVTLGGEDSPCVWFTVEKEGQKYRMSAAINTFRNKNVGIVSDYNFHPYRDQINAIPFGATLGKYILPDIDIEIE